MKKILRTYAPGFMTRSSAEHRAYTLIELLVAASITAAIAGVIAVLVSNISNTWTRTAGRLSADAQARIALDQITQDLEGAIYRDDGNTWMAANILDTTTNATGLWVNAQTTSNAKPNGSNGSLLLSTPSIADARYGLAGTWLRFFTMRRGSNIISTSSPLVDTISAPVAVSYQIVRRRTSAANLNLNTGYFLHRSEVRPSSSGTSPGVIESGYSFLPTSAYQVNTAGNTGSITGDPRSVLVPGSVTNLDSILADNVIDFGIRAYVRDPNGGLRLIFPADALGKPTGTASTRLIGLISPSAPLSGLNFSQHFPVVIDVMIRVLTDEGVRQIANMEKSPALTRPTQYLTPAAWWWAVATANSRVYTRRIVIKTEPL